MVGAQDRRALRRHPVESRKVDRPQPPHAPPPRSAARSHARSMCGIEVASMSRGMKRLSPTAGGPVCVTDLRPDSTGHAGIGRVFEKSLPEGVDHGQ